MQINRKDNFKKTFKKKSRKSKDKSLIYKFKMFAVIIITNSKINEKVLTFQQLK